MADNSKKVSTNRTKSWWMTKE